MFVASSLNAGSLFTEIRMGGGIQNVRRKIMELVKYEKMPCRVCGNPVIVFNPEKNIKPICLDCRVDEWRRKEAIGGTQ